MNIPPYVHWKKWSYPRSGVTQVWSRKVRKSEDRKCQKVASGWQQLLPFLAFFPYLVMYSKVTGSSTVSLWDWHSTRTCLINTRASAVRPGRGREVLVRQSCLGTWVKVEVKLETCKWHQHMLIQLADLAHCSAILWSMCILQYCPKRCLNTTFKEYKFSFKPPVLLKFCHKQRKKCRRVNDKKVQETSSENGKKKD